jgi:hypothetical protein
LVLGPSMSSVFISDWSAWPKNTYRNTPEAFSQGGSRETWNHETEAIPAKIGGGIADGVAPVAFPTSPTPPPWWRGSSPPLNYGFVAVAWSISLLCYVD